MKNFRTIAALSLFALGSVAAHAQCGVDDHGGAPGVAGGIEGGSEEVDAAIF